jgi:hypothetical protein
VVPLTFEQKLELIGIVGVWRPQTKMRLSLPWCAEREDGVLHWMGARFR